MADMQNRRAIYFFRLAVLFFLYSIPFLVKGNFCPYVQLYAIIPVSSSANTS